VGSIFHRGDKHTPVPVPVPMPVLEIELDGKAALKIRDPNVLFVRVQRTVYGVSDLNLCLVKSLGY